MTSSNLTQSISILSFSYLKAHIIYGDIKVKVKGQCCGQKDQEISLFSQSTYTTKMSWLGHFEIQLLDSTSDILANICRELEHICLVTEARKFVPLSAR